MTTFQKKPVQIEAVQWFEHGDHPKVRKCDIDTYQALTKQVAPIDLSKYGVCGTLEGEHLVDVGDWIITGLQGEIYPCKPEIFEQTYQEVVTGELVEAEIARFNTSDHWSDSEGTPAGGYVHGCGFSIIWQNGALKETQAIHLDDDGKTISAELSETLDKIAIPNGAFVENVLYACIDRLQYFQNSKFANQYNADAIHHIETAIAELNARTAEREARGVEGKHQV